MRKIGSQRRWCAARSCLAAVLVSEDAGFYGHMGVDLAEIRAAWAENAERGRIARGGSTITQQLVKNLLLTPEKTVGRTYRPCARSPGLA